MIYDTCVKLGQDMYHLISKNSSFWLTEVYLLEGSGFQEKPDPSKNLMSKLIKTGMSVFSPPLYYIMRFDLKVKKVPRKKQQQKQQCIWSSVCELCSTLLTL